MTTYSITRALAEIKRLDDRIERAIENSAFVAVTIGHGDKKHIANQKSTSVDNMIAKIQSDYDSIQQLFKNRALLKGAVVQSNALTKITVGTDTMTVAEAIELKKSIAAKQQLLSKMKHQLLTKNNDVIMFNTKLDAQIEAMLTTVYGNDKGKVEVGMAEAVAKPQRDAKEASLLDPLNLSDKIAKLEEQVEFVVSELDYSLSECNAKTEINVTL